MNFDWKKIFNGFVTMTLLKYVVAAVAQYLAVKTGVDQGTTQGILLQIVTVLMAGWGVGSATQDKVVVDGVRVPLAKMAPADKTLIKQIVHNR